MIILRKRELLYGQEKETLMPQEEQHLQVDTNHFVIIVRGGGIFNNIKIQVDSKRKEYTEGFLKDGISLSDVWTDIPALPHNSKEKVNHPTQKPLKLIDRIVKIGTNEGDLILDNVCGSGTTGLASINLGRKFIGIEKEQKYYEIAVKRIEDALTQINSKPTQLF